MPSNIKGVPLADLERQMAEIGHPAYRARQLFRWVNQKRVNDFSQMSDLSRKFQAECAERFALPTVEVAQKRESDDGTAKWVVVLGDGHRVESVYIPAEERRTLCVSTQVGCKMSCQFCATGHGRFKRNLQAWEIVEQLFVAPVPVTNIVLMGMGEPFDNYDEVMKALSIFSHPYGPQIGKRHITVSTVGISNKIEAFLAADIAKLAISLHGTTDETRSQIMPINRKFPLSELMDLCRRLQMRSGLRLTFEYVLLAGINDSDDDARRLVQLVKGIACKINLLAYNENLFVDIKRPSEERVMSFQRILLDSYLTVTYRRSRGRDIAAACGQLTTSRLA